MPTLFTRLAVSIFAVFLLSSVALGGDDWKPLDPADTALKAGLVDKDADAEVLFWEVKVNDGDPGETVFSHYIRMKIFNDRGKESQSKVDIPYLKNEKVQDVAARTIKADGTIVELKKEDIFDRTIVKVNGGKLKAKSFAVPGIEAGAIVEYRWKEVDQSGSLADFVRLQFQREIPVQKVTYYVKPYAGALGMSYQPFQLPRNLHFEKAKDGFYAASMTNVPAYIEEANMPPENSVRSWILIYYTAESRLEPDKYWKDTGRRVYENVKGDMKVNDDVRRAAADIVKDATTPEQKLQLIYEFCHTQIKNLSSELSGLTREERAKLKTNKNPADTLSKKAGRGDEIDMLFAALANAAGLEAHLALVANRNDMLFDSSFASTYFLARFPIAVKIGDGWKFFQPGSSYLPYGMLRWEEEGQQALITDAKEPIWVETPLSPPQKSLTKHIGRFTLLPDGTLEGDVRGILSGQRAIDAKNDEDSLSPAEREANLKQEIKSRLSTAELTDIKIENVTDPVKPYTYSYHVKIAGYAERTGKRLFLSPNYFKKGVSPLFSSNSRKNMVYFHYPWQEDDDIEIVLPDGYALDNADAPPPIGAQALSSYKASIGITKDNKTLVYHRTFFFGGGGTNLDRLLYPVASYPALKQYFDQVHKNDDHTLTLKQAVQTATNTSAQ